MPRQEPAPAILSRRERVVAAARAGLSRDALWPVILGFVFFVLAIISEYIGLLMAMPSSTSTEEVVRHFTSEFFSNRTIVVVLTDLGSAFVVAWVVSVAIEARSRHRQEQENRTYRSEISKNVFSAVYQLRHPSEYVKAAIEGVLSTLFLREQFEVTYKLCPLSTQDAAKAGVDASRFVRLTASTRYSVRNVTPSKEHFRLRYTIPRRSGRLGDLSRVRSLKIGDREYTDTEIDNISDGLSSSGRDHVLETYINGNDSIWITIDADMVKEVSDTETMGMKLPTLMTSVRLNIEGIHDLVFGLNAYSGSSVREVYRAPDGMSAHWVVDGPMLPWNSLLLWWRRPEDDGAPTEHAQDTSLDGAPTPAVPQKRATRPRGEKVISPEAESSATEPSTIKRRSRSRSARGKAST